MHIALTQAEPWRSAVESLGLRCTVVDTPPIEPGAALDHRRQRGEAALAALRGRKIDFILDTDGDGLWFTRETSGRADLAMVNDRLGVPLVSHFTRSVLESFEGMPWGHLWNCLQSRTWIKACADAAHAAELTAFGVPNVVCLPAAAPDADYAPAESTDSERPFTLGCPHVDHGAFFAQTLPISGASLAPGVIARCSVTAEARPTFFDAYFNRYELDGLPDPDIAGQCAERAARYFDAKAYHSAHIGIGEHARFVRFLRVRFGEIVRLLGTTDGNVTTERQIPLAERIAFHRNVGINIGLNFNRAESGPDARLFEVVAAGGFLLAHRGTGIGNFLQPGSECDVFDHEGDLLAKVQAYLEAPGARAAIAAAGQRRVLSTHLLSHRLGVLLKLPQLQRSAAGGEASAVDGAMPGDIAASVPGPLGPSGEQAGRLLILLNPGRMSRNWMVGIARGAERLGIPTRTLELAQAWERRATAPDAVARGIEKAIVRDCIAAAVGYTYNGCAEFRRTRDGGDLDQTPLCRLGIPQLMFWSDHPQWANERAGLLPSLQPLLRHPAHHHFVKSQAAADEVVGLLRWPHVYGLPPGEDTQRLCPSSRRRPEYDIVCIVGSPPAPLGKLEPLLDTDEPDLDAIHGLVAEQSRDLLRQAWDAHVPADRRPAFEALGRDWIDARRSDPLAAAYRHFLALRAAHTDACDWLSRHPQAYFAALHALWEFGRWQRTFVLRYLARYFNVGVFGYDWSSVGIGGGSGWVDYDDQPGVYARGRVALSVSQCGDEEGVAHKPFEITACGAACVHIRRRGIETLFADGREIALFDSPAEARQIVSELCADDAKRLDIAEAGRARTVRDHSWSVRLGQMLSRMGLAPGVFGLTSWENRAAEATAAKVMPDLTAGRTERRPTGEPIASVSR